jgi:hypothetical protein
MLVTSWRELGFARFPLDIIECPDRRLTRTAVELVAHLTGDCDTEVTILIPRREYTKLWHRILHDRSSNSIAAALGELPHCNVTIVPYHLGSRSSGGALVADDTANTSVSATNGGRVVRSGQVITGVSAAALPADRCKIAAVAMRQRATVAGRVRAMRIQPWGGNPSLEVSLADETGSVTIVFTGRRSIPGVALGTIMSITGVVGAHRGIQAILNPSYTLLFVPPAPENPGEHH